MRHKAIRLFFVLICCLAIPLIAQADQNNNNKKKKPQQTGQGQGQGQKGGQGQGQKGGQGQGQGQHQGQGQGQGQHQGKHQNGGNPNKGNNPNNPNNQGNANKGHKGNKGNNPNNPNNPSNVNKGNNGNKGKNWANNPNNVNKAKWQTKQYNFSKGPNANIKSVTFEKNYHINGCENWKGERYAVFRNYNCEWHDHSWWYGHYGANLALIAGGWYFLNAGYWAPAWGYNPAESYYPYNGPIYAYNNLPPDQVIANVQAALQAQGYYNGEIDGLLGPMTRDALSAYQAANNLYTTAAIDQPTLESLGLT